MAKSPLSLALAETVTKRSVLADGSLCFRTSKFTQVMTRLAPGRMLVTGIGYNDGRCAPLITEEMTRAMPPGGTLIAFVNLSAQTGQASDAREWWAEWAKGHREKLECTHMLVRSRMMDMAISVLGMLIGGGINAHSEQASFEAAITAAVPGFRQLPKYADLPQLLP